MAPEKEKNGEKLQDFKYSPSSQKGKELSQAMIQETLNAWPQNSGGYDWIDILLMGPTIEEIRAYCKEIYGGGKSAAPSSDGSSGSGENGTNSVNDGTSSSEDGGEPTYAGSMTTKAPSKWTAEAIDDACEKGGFNKNAEKLSKENNNVETGYFLVYDEKANTLTAQFYIGVSSTKWMNLGLYTESSPPGFPALNSNQMVIGFTHLHPGKNAGSPGFSPGDGLAIKKFALGEFSWTRIPYWSKNKDPRVLDRMFFGLVHYKGRDGLSFIRSDNFYY
jgi:hypothetical protein